MKGRKKQNENAKNKIAAITIVIFDDYFDVSFNNAYTKR